jgi:23S rRNA (pseudouridine1915-N3)-methyltransferase
MALERARIEAALPKGVRIIALDERGKDLTSVGLSQLDGLAAGRPRYRLPDRRGRRPRSRLKARAEG